MMTLERPRPDILRPGLCDGSGQGSWMLVGRAECPVCGALVRVDETDGMPVLKDHPPEDRGGAVPMGLWDA